MFRQICFSLCGSMFLRAIQNWDSYPWERGAKLRNVQVGHQGNSETVGEHQVGGYCIHYHSVRHGTANECQGDVVDTQGRVTQTNRGYMLPQTIRTCINNMIFSFSATKPTGSTYWAMRTVFCEIMWRNVIQRSNTISEMTSCHLKHCQMNWFVCNKGTPLTML